MNLNRLSHFAAVVDTRSFTRAAERLGVTKAVVSHQVAELERELGTTLLVRSTRRVEPTEAGRLFHARCVSILREADAAVGELSQSASEPTGQLRITAPNDFGIASVVPLVVEFVARHPKCQVDLQLRDQTVDLSSGQIDMAIRVGWLPDSSLRARQVGTFRQLLVGSAALKERLSEVRAPSDLTALPFVANTALRTPLDWCFTHEEGLGCDVRMTASISIDTTPAVLEAVLVGGGISILPDFLVAEAVAAGRLIHVLPDWTLPAGGIHAVFPAARFRPAKVTAFLDLLVAANKRKAPPLPPA